MTFYSFDYLAKQIKYHAISFRRYLYKELPMASLGYTNNHLEVYSREYGRIVYI